VNCFIFSWHPVFQETPLKLVSRQELLDQLDKMPEVKNWRASTGVIFVITDVGSYQLSAQIHGAFPSLLFTLGPVHISTLSGWTDPATWDFIRNLTSIK